MTFESTALTAFTSASAAASATGLNGGTVEFLTAGNTLLASASLGTPTASGAVTTMGGFPKSSAAVSIGTIASARYRTSGAANWKTGITVGLAASGAEVILSSLEVVEIGQLVTFTSAKLTHTGTAA